MSLPQSYSPDLFCEVIYLHLYCLRGWWGSLIRVPTGLFQGSRIPQYPTGYPLANRCLLGLEIQFLSPHLIRLLERHCRIEIRLRHVLCALGAGWAAVLPPLLTLCTASFFVSHPSLGVWRPGFESQLCPAFFQHLHFIL